MEKYSVLYLWSEFTVYLVSRVHVHTHAHMHTNDGVHVSVWNVYKHLWLVDQ